MEEIAPQTKPAVIVAVVATILASALLFIQYTCQRPGEIVIPAGGTYLGPSPTPIQSGQAQAPAKAEDSWKTFTGRLYSYSFSAPESLALTTFPQDPYDIYAISANNQNPASNVLIGVDDLSKTKDKEKYIKLPKRQYVSQWWKQFNGLSGVASIEEFTNKQDLKGYRAKFLNKQNQSPNTDVFFEIPNKPQYVIHLASGIVDAATFDKIVDSVAWKQ